MNIVSVCGFTVFKVIILAYSALYIKIRKVHSISVTCSLSHCKLCLALVFSHLGCESRCLDLVSASSLLLQTLTWSLDKCLDNITTVHVRS